MKSTSTPNWFSLGFYVTFHLIDLDPPLRKQVIELVLVVILVRVYTLKNVHHLKIKGNVELLESHVVKYIKQYKIE